jgi:hypothetical protein
MKAQIPLFIFFQRAFRRLRFGFCVCAALKAGCGANHKQTTAEEKQPKQATRKN